MEKILKSIKFPGLEDTYVVAGKVEVDTELSDTSENPVQNKVIKEVIDDLTIQIADAGSIEIDLEGSNEGDAALINADTLGGKYESDLSVADSAKLGGKTESELTAGNSEKLGGYSIDLLLNKIYPIGSIYLSVDSTSPDTLFGGTWVQIAQGRTLFGADDSTYIAGSTVEAGLPNITGTHSTNRYSGWEISGTGAFSGSTSTRTVKIDNGDNTDTPTFIADFNASNSNAIYGKSQTVQPPAFVVYMWQRTA